MRLNKTVISMIVLAGTLTVASVYAGDRNSNHRHEGIQGEQMVKRMVKKLDLSQAQQDSITVTVNEFQASNPRPSKTEMKAKHVAMKQHFQTLMASEQFDEAAVSQHFTEQAQQHKARKINMLKLQHAIYQQLTAEQQPKYLKMVAKKMRKMKGKMLKRNAHQHGDDVNQS